MIRARLALLAAIAAAALSAAPVAAQSDILLQLRSGSPEGDRFRVDSAGGFVALGSLGIGIIPVSGENYLTMWYPFKGAFRSGWSGTTGDWDDANVGFFSWAGGSGTVASGIYSIAFGDDNEASNLGASAFGTDNTASGQRSFTAGYLNTAASLASTSFGRNSWAGDSFRGATNSNGGAVALGHNVTADADWSFAGGYRASTGGRVGAFVWSGSLAGASAATDSLVASADGQFNIRAPGGIRFYTNTAMTVGVSVNAGGSSWNVISDRNRKENFLALDGEDVLARLRLVPVSTWQYRDEQDRTVRHVGPMAQDWHRAFGLNADATTINMSDFDGVNLAAIQALETRTAEVRTLRGEVDALKRRNADLEARMARLEALLAAPAQPKR